MRAAAHVCEKRKSAFASLTNRLSRAYACANLGGTAEVFRLLSQGSNSLLVFPWTGAVFSCPERPRPKGANTMANETTRLASGFRYTKNGRIPKLGMRPFEVGLRLVRAKRRVTVPRGWQPAPYISCIGNDVHFGREAPEQLTDAGCPEKGAVVPPLQQEVRRAICCPWNRLCTAAVRPNLERQLLAAAKNPGTMRSVNPTGA